MLTTTIDNALDLFDRFYISTLKKEMDRDETYKFVVNARNKGMNDFNTARLINVCINGSRTPITQLSRN